MKKTTTSPHILVVEDNDTSRTMIVRLLEQNGYNVMMSPDGTTAIHLLKRMSFDLVVTDLQVGHVNGIEVLSAARSQVRAPAVIIVTGDYSLEMAIAALRSGAYDYVLKPFQPAEFLERVRLALQRRAAEQIQFDAIRTIAHLVSRFNKETMLA
jgi:DNA-binding response OmpR family regulator